MGGGRESERGSGEVENGEQKGGREGKEMKEGREMDERKVMRKIDICFRISELKAG